MSFYIDNDGEEWENPRGLDNLFQHIEDKYFPMGVDDDSGGYDEYGDPIPYTPSPGAE